MHPQGLQLDYFDPCISLVSWFLREFGLRGSFTARNHSTCEVSGQRTIRRDVDSTILRTLQTNDQDILRNSNIWEFLSPNTCNPLEYRISKVWDHPPRVLLIGWLGFTLTFGASEVLATLHRVFSEPQTSEVEDPLSTCLHRWTVQMNFWALRVLYSALLAFFWSTRPPNTGIVWHMSPIWIDGQELFICDQEPWPRLSLWVLISLCKIKSRVLMDRVDQRPRVIAEIQLAHALISFPISAMRRCSFVVGSISTVDLLI